MNTTLPARYYNDPDVFRAEMERFFFHRWIYAGREERIKNPGDYFLCDVGGESVIITRDQAGQAHAFFNVCRHRGTRMCTDPEGTLPGRIQCPYHSWTYTLEGNLIGASHMPEGFRREDYPLHTVDLDSWARHLFLNFARGHEPLAAQLGELPSKFAAWRMADLEMRKRVVYDVKANWKLIILNYNECLHCPTVHPGLNKLTDYLGADNEPATPNYIGGSMGFRPGAETMTADGVRRRAYLPGLSADQRQMVCYYAIYPNLLLALHPDYMLTHTLWPKAPDRTEIVCEWHFQPAETGPIEDAVGFWDQVNREDWHVSELSQLGISSRAYTPGPYSKREELLHGFDQLVRESE